MINTSNSFGSDHLAVFATTGDIAVDDTGSLATDSITITNALPNPSGTDAGNETVTLTYSGSDITDISGWSLRDQSGRTYTFGSGTQLKPEDNEIRLLVNSMPLNNSGDTITLFDPSGVQVGDIFEYSALASFQDARALVRFNRERAAIWRGTYSPPNVKMPIVKIISG